MNKFQFNLLDNIKQEKMSEKGNIYTKDADVA